MNHSIQYIADQLKAGRELKGLSQRELGELSGVTQSQISRIERGTLDPQLTTLVELARALDLELMLVPRSAMSAVSAIVRSSTGAGRDASQTRKVAKWLKRLNETLSQVSNVSEMEEGQSETLSQIARQVRDLSRFNLSLLDPGELRKASDALRTYKEQSQGYEAFLSQAMAALQHVRDSALRASSELPRQEKPRAAYAVSETNDD